jgi:hypothetical protein
VVIRVGEFELQGIINSLVDEAKEDPVRPTHDVLIAGGDRGTLMA